MPLHLSAMISSSDKEKIASLVSLGQGESQKNKSDSPCILVDPVYANKCPSGKDEELRGRQAFALAVATRHWFIEVQNAEIAYLWFFFTFFFLKFYFLSYKTVQFPLELKLRMQKDYMVRKV